MHKIHDSLLPLAIDIELLLPLDKNPRRGNVQAIIASYEEFGQIRPIVARPNGDGTFTVVAGNHQLQAAKQLGWEKIAVVQYEVDDERAIAFAIADNRTVELGYTEPEILNELIVEINDYYPELLEGLGWDEFELAEIEQQSVRDEHKVIESGSYVPPVMTSRPEYEEHNNDEDVEELDNSVLSISQSKDGKNEITLKSGLNHDDAAVRGATTAVKGSAPSATVTVQITFDNTDQQAKWYEFIKSLKMSAKYAGSTVAEKIISFIDKHSE